MPERKLQGPQPWPSLAGWLDDSVSPLEKAIVLRAFCDILIAEMPLGSNRSGRIDTYNQRAGAPLESYYCASWMSCVFEDCGADTPPLGLRTSCHEWQEWAKRVGCASAEARPGYGVIYHNDAGYANHCGIAVRTSPLLRSVEANTTVAGYNRNGNGMEAKIIDPNRVSCYIKPRKKLK